MGSLSGVFALLVFAAVIWVLQRFGPSLGLDLSRGADPAASRRTSDYDRKAWPHWSDADGDCQDTRQEVLIAESETPVKFKTSKRCRVKSGRWRCPYTGRTFTDPRKLDVDHLVPLAETHRSGGHAWDRDRRERYANALDLPAHLVAVERGSNRAKADKGPEAWMPKAKAYRCEYLEAWRTIKQRWALDMDPREQAYVEQAQRACTRGEIPALPAGQRR